MDTVTLRVEKHRKNLRKQGLRPLQIWVPDTRKAGFEAEAKRQSKLCDDADIEEAFLDQSLQDIEGWE